MSRAVDRCPACVRPWAFLKVDFVMPSARAVRFMRSEKRASLPEMASPMAVAASLADLMAAARIRWRIAMRWPARRPSREGGWLAACFDTVTMVSSVISPRWIASKAM